MSRLFLPGRAALFRARRETALSRRASGAGAGELKKGAHGGNMVSPVAKRPDWVGIPVAGIERLMHQAAEAL
jgi:hypothetical protein